ncbi:polyketide antibiotic transporter [Gryllotalpicola koreensis]|uniref:Exporter of polyketide antibiotics n=1 Tax=Gryllotalpicola koreensis TaxID=993086 RepID=A0ABP7ZU09_9MICO
MFGTLLRFRLRRDRTQLTVWAVVHFLVAYMVVAAVNTTYGTPAERAATVKVLMVTPAILLFRGTPQGTSAGDFMALLGLTFMAVLVAFQSTFLVVRHTRAEEATGQTETVAATAAGRWAPSFAVIALGVIANVIAMIAVAIGCLAGGLPAGGSWLFGAGLGMVGLTFVGVAFLLAQLFPASRSANGWSATLVLVAYVVRGLGDATGTPHLDTLTLTPTAWIWASPIGWAQRTLPWSGYSRGWPLLLGVASFLILTAVALLIQDRRDVGAGILAERRGRPTASAALAGAVGLALRLQRGVLTGWVLAVVAGALLLGSLAGVMVDQLQTAGSGVTNALEEIGGGGSMLQAFANIGAIFSGLLASAICVQGAMRLRQEEAAGGLDAVLSTATARTRWMLSFVVVAAVGAVVSLVLGGVVAGAVAGSAGGGFATWFWAIVWETPAVLVFLGVVALVFAVLPQATVGVGWAVFGLGAILGLFGPLFGLPQWARDLAPFAHTPAVALPHPNFTGGWVMAVIAVALIGASVYLFRLRDTRPGA